MILAVVCVCVCVYVCVCVCVCVCLWCWQEVLRQKFTSGNLLSLEPKPQMTVSLCHFKHLQASLLGLLRSLPQGPLLWCDQAGVLHWHQSVPNTTPLLPQQTPAALRLCWQHSADTQTVLSRLWAHKNQQHQNTVKPSTRLTSHITALASQDHA